MRISRARPAITRVPGLLVLPGFPRGAGGAAALGNTDQTLCDRIARESGWAGLTFTFRGTGPSEGDFSIEGWLADVRAAVDALHARTDITGVWIAGFRLGGTLATVVAADDERVRGIATFAAPASLRTWVREPEWFLEYARAGRACCATPSSRPIPTRGSARSRISIRSRRRNGSRRGRGCSCTAAPTTSCRSRTRAGSRPPAATASTCGSWRTARTDCATTRARSRRSLGWLDRQEP